MPNLEVFNDISVGFFSFLDIFFRCFLSEIFFYQPFDILTEALKALRTGSVQSLLPDLEWNFQLGRTVIVVLIETFPDVQSFFYGICHRFRFKDFKKLPPAMPRHSRPVDESIKNNLDAEKKLQKWKNIRIERSYLQPQQ